MGLVAAGVGVVGLAYVWYRRCNYQSIAKHFSECGAQDDANADSEDITSSTPSSNGPTPSLPAKAGSSGNCSWDAKGFYCWNSTACGGKCKQCYHVGRTKSISTGCNQVRAQFLKNTSKCSSCAIANKTWCPGKSGNCTWDCTNAFCWTSGGQKWCGRCTGCGNNVTKGCSLARDGYLRSQCTGLTGGTLTACLKSHGVSAMARALSGYVATPYRSNLSRLSIS